MKLDKLDLNLLKVVDMLLQEGSVSRAADRFSLSQPALSHALARARTALGDELLVRDRGRMVPTPYAHRIRGRLRALLEEVQAIVEESAIEHLEDLELTLKLGLSDYTHFLFLEKIYGGLSLGSRNIRIISRNVSLDQLATDLSGDKLDLIIAFSRRPLEHVREELLFEDRHVCLIKKERSGDLSLDAYLGGRHIIISYDGHLSGPTDEILEARGLHRNVVISTPHVIAAASMASTHGFIMTCPSSIAKVLTRDFPLRMVYAPFEMPPLRLTMAWHPRSDNDAVASWMRGVIRTIVRKEAERFL